jgi:glycosyltransferase involved in cell wall biosynthesis
MTTFCIIIPVYKNELNISALLDGLNTLHNRIKGCKLSVTFVIDGSPDKSYEAIKSSLSAVNFSVKLVNLSRNFGAVTAVRAGLHATEGDYFAVMAADSQEPIELYLGFLDRLQLGDDVVIGRRAGRVDSTSVKLFATIGWWIYKNFVFKELPVGGADVFACTRRVRDTLISFSEKNSSLIGAVYWIGYQRSEVLYSRKKRLAGVSSWNFFKSFRYFLDSCFNFSDAPIRVLWILGLVGVSLALLLGTLTVLAKLFGAMAPEGYSTIVVTILLIGGINLVGIGIVGEYVVRAFENSKRRPEFIIATEEEFPK